MSIPQLLKPSEARKRLNMGERQFYALIQNRGIGYVLRGNRYLIPESEIARLIERDFRPARRDFFRHRASPPKRESVSQDHEHGQKT